ncbi:MAG: UDP-galactopyranose mutase [Desulfovibrio sp.]|nr:UDP-galactopyranose mutase [Desulfovibrio sp.]
MQFCIVGSGCFGATVARLVAEELDAKVLVIDERKVVGGNSTSFLDPETGIECHAYGSHIFHTSKPKVWQFVSRFTTLNDYHHRVFIRQGESVYPMPINLATINQFYKTHFSPSEAAQFLADEIAKENLTKPANLEEKAISLIGRPLYEAFIKGYTEKQWGCAPCKLPENIITRLPVRHSYHADYFDATWQGLPLEGYQAFFSKILDHKNITLKLETSFAKVRASLPSDCFIVYTGRLDRLFDYVDGELGWRSLNFDFETVAVRDYQGTAVMNFADLEVPYTRIHEFKHYHRERTKPLDLPKTVICREYPVPFKRDRQAYYPLETAANKALQAHYLEKTRPLKRFFCGGRLGAYRYWDMDVAIEQAMELFQTEIRHTLS